MEIAPIFISIAALLVSITSLLITRSRARVDRQLQWEQLRGRLYTRMTGRCLDLLTLIEEVRLVKTPERIALTKKLVRILEGLTEIRKSLGSMKKTVRHFHDEALMGISPLVSDIDDADLIFDRLIQDVRSERFDAAERSADGLIERLFGTGKSNQPVETTEAAARPPRLT